jgi:uncharacterized membrane protein YhaH (DUF805 family)
MNIMSVLFSFEGRASRLQFWAVYCGMVAVFVVFGISMGVDLSAVDAAGNPAMPGGPAGAAGLGLLVLSLVSFWVSLAINAKRFHDRDKSGWWVLIGLVPVIGGLWILIECGFLAGTAGSNRFGAGS